MSEVAPVWQEIAQEVSEYLMGTCKSKDEAALHFDIPANDVSQAVAYADEIELCITCGWWFETWELEDYQCPGCCDED